MLSALTRLLAFQLLGEIIARGLDLPVPGPVLGMLLLFAYLVVNDGPDPKLQHTGQQLLQHLSLLFVPAGTGIMVHLHRVQEEWLALSVTLVISTCLSLAVTALVMARMGRGTTAQGEA